MIKQTLTAGFIISVLLIIYFTQPVTISQIRGSDKTINIAIVRNGATGDVEITKLIEPELLHLLGDEYTFSFIESQKFNAEWDPNKFRSVVENALNDETIDIILGVGAMVTQEAASDEIVLTKPFVSTTLLTGDVPPLPYSMDDHSQKENLSLVILPSTKDKDFNVLNRLIQVDTLHFGVPVEEIKYLKNFSSKIDSYSKQIGVAIIPVPIYKDVAKTISELPARIKAFYFRGTPRLSIAERKAIIDSLITRKIPVFSGMGLEDIELGVFATNKPNMHQEIARRTAINLFRIIRGEQASSLPVFLVSDFKLIINGKTAAKIGYYPDYNTRINATILYREYLEGDVKEINLKEALLLAAEGNASLAISSSTVQTSLQESRIARGFMFPQLGLTADYNYIGWKKFNELVPENFARFGVGISQMVFDDEVISNFSSAGSQYEAAEFKYESDKLDIYLQAARTYLNYVQARLFHQIELENLRLTESNLDVARMRVDVGQAGRDEVYRWTTELENRKAAVLNAEAIIEATRISLNQVLGLNQNINWLPEEIEIKPGEFYFLVGKLDDIFESQANLKNFRESSIKVSLQNSPELQFLYKSIEAQEIQIGQQKRSFILPKIYADFGYGNNFWQDPNVPPLDKSGITFGLTARLPIFEGTSKIYRIQRGESVRDELTNTVLLTEQLLEQRTRTSISRLESSFPNLSLSKNAAENAKLNLDVVREKYANGIASITDLLEAQNASFVADQNSITAIYRFLGDLIQYQRSISFFVDIKSQEEKDEFLLKFYEDQNQ